MSRSLQQFIGTIEFPSLDDRVWRDGPWIGLSTIRESIAKSPPIFRREAAEAAIAHSPMATVQAIEATRQLDVLWPDFSDWRGPKP
jgi:hypothetical protein